MNIAAARTSAAWLLTLALVATGLTVHAEPALAQSQFFSDTDGSVHAEAIELIAIEGITTGYPDGTYKPRRDVRRDQMATFLTDALGLKRQAPSFPDVPEESVHYGAIGALAASKITTGFKDGEYKPLRTVTRGQMATFLTAGLKLPPGNRTFEDVPADYVHADAIAALAASGITEGFPDGTFRPNAPVKRDQMAAFLVRGLGLVRCPPEADSSVSSSDDTATTSSTTTTSNAQAAESDVQTAQTDSTAERGSEDLEESPLEAPADGSVTTSSAATTAETENLGPAVPAVYFPISSALRVGDHLEAHSFGLPNSSSVRVQTGQGNDVTGVTTGADGQRTWATASLGETVYVGQWGTRGDVNLWSYPGGDTGDRSASAVAAVPDGGEFWSLAPQGNDRLWAGTRAHASGTFRATLTPKLETRGDVDNRHVVHRIDIRQKSVKNVLFEAPCLPTLDSGLRPDVKQVDSYGGTLYVGLGQQTGGARLYAFEPGERLDIPQRDVRLISPDSVATGTGIFTLEVTADHVAFGTQGGPGVAPRLVVLDRRTEQVRVDIALAEDETRVDAIALSGRTLVASVNSGKLYRVTIPTSGTLRKTPAPFPAPVDDQLNRYVEFTPSGLRGVTNLGVVWTRSDRGTVAATNLIDTGAPGAPGQPHSLHVGATELAVGSNAAVNLRPLSNVESPPRTVNLTGEAKALASAPNGDTFAATYPHAELQRIPEGATEIDDAFDGRWNEAFLRPAAAVYDTRDDRVRVLAREDNAPRSSVRVPGTAGTIQLRPSRLFSLRADGTASDAERDGLPLAGDPAWAADDRNEGNLVEARAVAVPSTGGGSITYVGDTFGGVQAVDPTASEGDEQRWYRQLGGTTPRPIIDIDVVGNQLVVTASGAPAGTDGAIRTVVHDLTLDPGTGDVLDVSSHTLGTPQGASAEVSGVGDAVSRDTQTVFARTSDVLVYDRAAPAGEQLRVVDTHAGNDTFGGPYVALDPRSCDVYGFAARDLFRAQLPGCTADPVPLPLEE